MNKQKQIERIKFLSNYKIGTHPDELRPSDEIKERGDIIDKKQLSGDDADILNPEKPPKDGLIIRDENPQNPESSSGPQLLTENENNS